MDKKRQYKCIVCSKYYTSNFRRFPTEPELVQKFLDALYLKSFKPSQIICYNHFNDETDFIYSETDPNYKRVKTTAVPSKNITPPRVSYALCNETFFLFCSEI